MVPTTLFWAVSITATASSLNRPTYALGAAAATPGPVQNNHPAIRAEIPTVIATRLRMLASWRFRSLLLLLSEMLTEVVPAPHGPCANRLCERGHRTLAPSVGLAVRSGAKSSI